MKNHQILMPKIFCIILGLFLGFMSIEAYSLDNVRKTDYEKVIISTGAQSGDVEKKVAQLLKDRLLEKSDIAVIIKSEPQGLDDDGLIVLLGQPGNHKQINKIFKKFRIKELTELAPGPEGFLLKNIGSNVMVAAGVDDRGCLYAVGELLRQIKPLASAITVPSSLDIRTAPAFEIRGTQYGQSGVAKRLAKVRDWTEEETQRVILDYALAGANIFSTGPGPILDFIKSFGLMTQGGFGANTAPETQSAHPDWVASESIGRKGYVCLSLAEARIYMLQKFEAFAQNSPAYDLLKFHGGDGGGCECDSCDPYGLKFIKLVEEMANIFHKYHPDAKVYFTNQKFDNDDDNAIFSYLQETPRPWLWAWGYGPGSDAASWQPGHRQTHRMDLFRYPGFGPYGLYPQEILHQLPPQQKLVFYNEITHWKYAQHAYIQMYPRADRNGDLPPHWSHDIYERQPDQFLTMVYNRLTFYAWPRQYHRVFNDLMRYGVGDITHSSGHHDHFNQWMWQRLLWSPRLTVEEVVDEYCLTWFGKNAAPHMSEAIFQLEENLEDIPGKPLPEKEGILNYYNLVKSAGGKMPENLMRNNWIWRMYMQKGALDRYVQLAVDQQMELLSEIESKVKAAMKNKNGKDELKMILTSLNETLPESQEMKQLHEEAGNLGEESNRIYGVRNDGYFNLSHDYVGLGWLRRQLQRAIDAPKKERRELLRMIVDYENPGENGYYDNLGTANIARNVVNGYPYDHGQPYVSQMLSEENRPSQRSMHFTQEEKQGVTLHYSDLDPLVSYQIRFTLVRPWYQERYAMRMNQTSESIYADDILIADKVELPLQMSDFFTFEIPKEATADGELIIRFEKSPDVANGDRVKIEQWRNSGGWGTIVSEAWLMKK